MIQDTLPIVSICVPAYKNLQLLSRCLQSIVSQTYKHIEIIITDDTPGDEIENYITETYPRTPAIKYFRNTPALGTPENWNEGLRLAKGSLIKVMHHDDWFPRPDALEMFVQSALTTDADFICANCFNVFPEKTIKRKILARFKTKWAQNRKIILFANYIGNPSTVLFKAPKENHTTYDNKSLWYVDVLFYYEYVIEHKKVAFITENLVSVSGGLETQVTNQIVDSKIRVNEFLYVAQKHNLFNDHSFLTKLTLIEILSRCKIKSKSDLDNILDFPLDVPLPYYLLKIPIHHQFYNVLKHMILLS